MSYQVLITFISVLFIYFGNVHSTDISRKKVSTLRNKHLVTAVAQIPISAKLTRNGTGHIVEMEGVSPLILEWLSRRFKFQYTVFNVNTSNVEDGGPNLPGLLNYLLRGECDTIMSAIYPTMERISSLNFVHPWTYTPTCVLISKPDVSDNNVDALTKPFQIWVWLGLIISIMAVIITLWCFNKSQQTSVSKFNNISMYVLETLLNQGSYVSNKSTTIRLVIGGWCLLVLVLLNTYNGTLISYVTAIRTEQPLVNSIEDILKNPSVNLVVDKGKAPDVLFSTAVKGIYKELGDKLRSFPKSRCNSSRECIDMVKSFPPRHVFVNAQAALKFIIREEYLRTKKCQLSIVDGGKGFSSRPLSWVLTKKSPYVQEFNLGFSMLHDVGLINFWEQQMIVTRPCYNEKKTNDGTRTNTKKLVRLTLGNLAGAFVILAIGFLLSFIVFMLENIVHRTVF